MKTQSSPLRHAVPRQVGPLSERDFLPERFSDALKAGSESQPHPLSETDHHNFHPMPLLTTLLSPRWGRLSEPAWPVSSPNFNQ
jgi:hypothetical protein